jgi:hypothetical protein
MLMTNMLPSRREGATQNAYLVIFVKFLARLLSLPFDREGIGHIFGYGRNRQHKHCYGSYGEWKFGHWKLPHPRLGASSPLTA